MPVLTRKPDQIVHILPRAGVLYQLTVQELFANGPIEILVRKVDGRRARLRVQEHHSLLVVRTELEGTAMWKEFHHHD